MVAIPWVLSLVKRNTNREMPKYIISTVENARKNCCKPCKDKWTECLYTKHPEVCWVCNIAGLDALYTMMFLNYYPKYTVFNKIPQSFLKILIIYRRVEQFLKKKKIGHSASCAEFWTPNPNIFFEMLLNNWAQGLCNLIFLWYSLTCNTCQNWSSNNTPSPVIPARIGPVITLTHL